MSISTKDFSDYAMIVFSHLRWDGVFQRPQHIATLAARKHCVIFIEEPIKGHGVTEASLSIRIKQDVRVLTPLLPEDGDSKGEPHDNKIVRELISGYLKREKIKYYFLWFYTPKLLSWAEGLNPAVIVYDCMDELANFKFADPLMHERERELFKRAEVVFTGGLSLQEAKQKIHGNVHCFPSSVDFEHFSKARGKKLPEPEVQAAIPHPKIGFYGVVDERFDIELFAEVTRLLPRYHFPIIGPFAKIDPADLPKAPNIHYLGQQDYSDLPNFLVGWDIAAMWFAINDATRYISPTKTPEYLAAGLPVISTPIRDVVRQYAGRRLVRIESTAGQFAQAIRMIVEGRERRIGSNWRTRVDEYLSHGSWKQTQQEMFDIVEQAIIDKQEEQE